MRYTVDPNALNAGADHIARALEHLGSLRLEEDLGPLRFAFAGGVTVGGLKAITNQWDIQLSGARGQLRILGSALVQAADGYGGLESLTAQQLRAVGPQADE
ncbi:hypothetical protein N864_12680 [Intrasporangium chromatireducens Q5-1]|uniref:Uncharacterized protein n=1 Tax=Intrasporangium chromatireducens Q5-1 TaxID=584657 RepID=W9GE62_9MICO|nr:hypothetical protein [Intrasporangium chromatireducens]EWT04486.1 hypothetical protein N864_12680 [Intrasporangium chromatireducens Q5-1]